MSPGPISREEFWMRQHQVRDSVAALGFAGCLVLGGPFYDRPGDLAYLTGHYPPFPSVGFEGSYRGLGFGALILPIRGAPILVTDTKAFRVERVAVDDVRPARNVPEEIRRALHETGLRSGPIAVIGAQVAPWALLEEVTAGTAVTISPSDEVVRDLRRTKSPAEIAKLRHAVTIAELGMRAALDAVRPGATEASVAAVGVGHCLEAGADFVRYLRVLSGPYSSWPHRWPPATLRHMIAGETVYLDLIGAVDGYQFDILRTVPVDRSDVDSQAFIDVAAEATQVAIAACGPEVAIRDVIAASDAVLEREGLLSQRSTFTGHGIGIETVESPLVMADSEDSLRPGDVICVEPGVLQPGIRGARFEYEVLITEAGHEMLATG